MLSSQTRNPVHRLYPQIRHQSFPLPCCPPLSESTLHSDVPPNCQSVGVPPKNTKPKTPEQCPPLECEETMDSCQVPVQSQDFDEEAILAPAPLNLTTASGSFIREIHNGSTSEPYVDVEIEELDLEETDSSLTTKYQDYVYSLLDKETQYACNPFALKLLQSSISPVMRTILLDWMMEVCSEFALKRETYYLAVNYVDRFLSLRANVKKEEFQLLGVTAMFIAAKTEEICNPKISNFARSADNGYSEFQIKAMEMTLFRTFNWRILPPTAFSWVNLAMFLWDDYLFGIYGATQVRSSAEVQKLPVEKRREMELQLEEQMVQFKQSNQHSYRRYRETMQILDAAYLDVGVLRYSGRHVVAGLMYLMVSKYFYETQYRLFAFLEDSEETDEVRDSLALLFGSGDYVLSAEEAAQRTQVKNAKVVQEIYIEFTQKALEIHNIEEIYPTIAFLQKILDLKLTFELPQACNLHSKAQLESHYEDFLAYQTHNSNNVHFISQKLQT